MVLSIFFSKLKAIGKHMEISLMARLIRVDTSRLFVWLYIILLFTASLYLINTKVSSYITLKVILYVLKTRPSYLLDLIPSKTADLVLSFRLTSAF